MLILFTLNLLTAIRYEGSIHFAKVFIAKGNDTELLSNKINEEQFACKAPTLNPWDPTIIKFINHPKPIKCDYVQPFLTFVDDEGYLRLNKTEENNILKINITFICQYSTFDRKFGGNDEDIQFDDEIVLKTSIKLTKDTVSVKCKYAHNNEQFYWNVHAHPVNMEELIFALPSEKQLTLLFQLIDSTSHSALQRNLPLTYSVTKDVMGMKYFSGTHYISF